MKDFPMFPTEYGVVSLILKEIPYRGEAYIRLRQVQPGCLEELLGVCSRFARMAGADRIYASHWKGIERYPLHTAVLELRRGSGEAQQSTASLFPVTADSAADWRQLYNEGMHKVDNAGTLEARDEARLLEKPGAYFVRDGGELLGIGWLEGNQLLALVGVKPGAGGQIVNTLAALLGEEPMTLEVASTNTRALRLYEKLGFSLVKEISRWYEVSSLAVKK